MFGYGKGMYHTLTIQTQKEGFYDITNEIEDIVRSSGIKSGICIVFSPHTSCGITINENTDPDVQHDLKIAYTQAFPEDKTFRHFEGNSSAHAKTSAVGSSTTVIVEENSLLLGIWQAIYLVEFDGPRRRNVFVKVKAD